MSSTNPRTLALDTYEFSVDEVTLYASATQAQITRSFEVSLEPGQTQIDLSFLPSGLEEDNIRLEAHGASSHSVTILDVICKDIASDDDNNFGHLSLEEAERQLREERAKVEVLSTQAALVEGYSQKATPGEVKVADMMTLIDFVGSKTRELRDALETSKANSVQLEASIKQLELEKESGKALPIHKRKSEDARNGRRRKMVRVLLEFEGDGEVAGRSEAARRTVTLKLIYIVHGATWTPSYDVRALSAGASSSTGEKKASEKGEKSPISITYFALIVNNTTEPWSNATITLSTATPTRRTAIPELHPYRLGLPGLPQHSPPMTLGSAPGAFPRGGARMMTMAAAPAPMMAKSFGRVAPETVPEGDRMNTLMRIEGRVDVDCDGASHKIGITNLDLLAELTHISVPSADACAFLRASIKNSSAFPLLPGRTSIYLDGTFVSKGDIRDVSPQETFELSLGIDGAVRVIVHPEERFKRTFEGLFASSKVETAAYAQKVTIENTHSTSITLLVRSRYPISEDQKIIVRPIHPATLPAFDADGQGGVTRWVEGKKEQGLIEWSGKVGPREKKVIKNAWEVDGSDWQVLYR